jgi:hypothetical protein
MPGRLPSEEPAIEGPARMKAKPRIKLIVRIGRLQVQVKAPCAVWWVTDNQWLFPDVCSKEKNGFVV